MKKHFNMKGSSSRLESNHYLYEPYNHCFIEKLLRFVQCILFSKFYIINQDGLDKMIFKDIEQVVDVSLVLEYVIE